MTKLRGITWNHLRGYGPLEASTRVYRTVNPNVKVVWERRTLQQFADYPVDRLAKDYDMIVFDHPSLGEAVSKSCLLALDSLIPPEYLRTQKEQSVGLSYSSYSQDDHQWALAIDAAAQVSAYRPDLLSSPPTSWEEVLSMARDRARTGKGRVAMPLIPIDAYSAFLSLCANRGESLYSNRKVVSQETGVEVLQFMRHILQFLHTDSLSLNPPCTLETMSTTDEIVYVPLIFGYSNYSRAGFRPHLIRFKNVPSSGRGPIGSTLGGAGLAISSSCKDANAAARYAMWICDAKVQSSMYFEEGGQPGNRKAWLDNAINKRSNDFFNDTLETLESANLRPRFSGFLKVQETSATIIHNYLLTGGSPSQAVQELNRIYQNAMAH